MTRVTVKRDNTLFLAMALRDGTYVCGACMKGKLLPVMDEVCACGAVVERVEVGGRPYDYLIFDDPVKPPATPMHREAVKQIYDEVRELLHRANRSNS